MRGEDRFGERREVGGGAKSGAEGGHRSTVPEKEKRKWEKTQCKKFKNDKRVNDIHSLCSGCVFVVPWSWTYCISNSRRILFRCAVR